MADFSQGGGARLSLWMFLRLCKAGGHLSYL
jgi:hypothetical protein